MSERWDVAFSGKEDAQLYVGEVEREIEGYSFKKGQQLLLGVASSFTQNPPTVFFLYEPASLKFRGCMPASMFKPTGLYVLEPPEPEVVEEQMTLFEEEF